MSKRAKTLLLIFLFILFAFIAPLTFLYSKGYQFDISTKKFVQLGGLYFKVRPNDAEITITDTSVKKTSIFFGTALFENLLPKIYEVKIEKEGYFTWQKNLEVIEQIVTEAKDIILIPVDLEISTMESDIEDFWFSEDEKNMIYKKIGGKDILWTIAISDIKNLETKVSTTTAEKLAVVDVLIPKIIATSSLAHKLFSDSIIWLGKDGFLYSSDINGKTSEKINTKELAVKPKAIYRVEATDKSKIFIFENSTLYYFNSDIDNLVKISDSAKYLNFSPNNKKFVFYDNYELWIYFIERESGQPPRQAGEKIFLMEFPEKIGNVFWLTSNYLIFNTGNEIKVSEIDDRDRINSFSLADFENPKIFFNQVDKKLYILSKGNLIISSNPLIR
ncbi:MAG: hypothetical protein Q7T34_01780 [Candidatus Parcubacteria bacterium]|nr:hypothetical protein [Candidatus Parcubacteria bacterium]